MSSEGGAVIVAVPVGLIAAPAMIVVGGVVLIAAGAVWVGKQLHARYEARCASWATGEQDAAMAARRTSQSLDTLLERAQQQFLQTVGDQRTGASGPSTEQMRAFRATIEQAYAQAASTSAAQPQTTDTIAAPAEDPQLTRARSDLIVEIAVAKDQRIPGHIIADAEQAQHGTLQQINAAKEALRSAWASVTDTERHRAHQREVAMMRLAAIEGLMNGVQSLSDEGRLTMISAQKATLDELQGELRLAKNRLTDAPDRALADAEALQPRVDAFSRTVMATSASASQAASQDRIRAAKLRGRVRALRALTTESGSLKYVRTVAVEGWLSAINTIESDLDKAAPDVSALEARVKDIEQAVFEVVNSSQQRAVAGQIAEVMAEVGFKAIRGGEEPIIEDIAEGEYRVVGVRNDGQQGAKRDDKIVTFLLNKDGKLAYDFSGYVGNACHDDAEVIFEGLRRRGIIITNEQWLPHEGADLTYEQAQANTPLPSIITNKEQAIRAEALVAALQKMGYAQDEIEVNAIGPDIHINASKSGLGYYRLSVGADGASTTPTHRGESPLADPIAPLRQALEQPLPPPPPPQHKKERKDRYESRLSNRGLVSE